MTKYELPNPVLLRAIIQDLSMVASALERDTTGGAYEGPLGWINAKLIQRSAVALTIYENDVAPF